LESKSTFDAAGPATLVPAPPGLGRNRPVAGRDRLLFEGLASTFPHAFVRLTGIDETTGQPFDANYGFTPVRVTPGILLGPVRGMMHTADPLYVSRSDRHFSLKLSRDQYRAVVAVVEKWRDAQQPSYRLESRNCVHFVAEVATVLGLHAPPARGLMKRPRSFLQKVTGDNRALIAQWEGPSVTPGQSVGQ
jgi:hypothetical protein